MYPWPFGVDEALLDRALQIAIDYLELTGQAHNYDEVRRRAAEAILAAYREGARHPIRLSNRGIMAQAAPAVDLRSFYPRVS